MDDTYAKELSRHAIARAGVALGIKSCKEESLDVLADVVKNLIQTVAVRTRNSAELSERSYGGIQDVIQTLENVAPFDINWKSVRDFGLDMDTDDVATRESKWSQPFPFEVAKFPIEAEPLYESSMFEADHQRDKYHGDVFVPSHLPAYPERHTYQLSRSSSSSKGKKRVRSTNAPEVSAAGGVDERASKRKITSSMNRAALESLMALENNVQQQSSGSGDNQQQSSSSSSADKR